MNTGILVFSSDYYYSPTDPWDYDVTVIAQLIARKVERATVISFIDNMVQRYSETNIALASIEVTGYYSFSDESIDLGRKRRSEVQVSRYSLEDDSVSIIIKVDKTKGRFYENLLQLLNMLYTVSTLVYAYISSSKDSLIFISHPMRKIATVFNNVLRNPLDIIFNPFYIERNPKRTMFKDLEPEHQTIAEGVVHWSVLLSYCFGKKMVPIITSRLVIQDCSSLLESSGDKYCAYFALIEVRDFMDRVDPNNLDSVLWLQTVVDVIYSITDQYNGGAMNLKLGKFFLVWKLKSANKEFTFKEVSRESSETASLIITTVLKILYGIAFNLKLFEVQADPRSIARSTIHCGLLYECISGSQRHKLDVHYFGLDLNHLHVYHQIAKHYRVNVFFTQSIYLLIPECMKVKCRKIDVVKLPITSQPIDLYTVDIRLDEVRVTAVDLAREDLQEVFDCRLAHQQMKDNVDDKLIKGAKNSLFIEDKDFENLLSLNYDFRKLFRNAIDFYQLGAWDSSKKLLEDCFAVEPDDGPSRVIYSYMETFGFEKKANWRGFRVF